MSSVHRFFVLLLISCFVFGIAPNALAADVSCGDTVPDVLIATADEVHDYLIDLVSGSLVTIDVDAEEINSTLDTALEVQDPAGQTLFFVDDFTPDRGEVSLDPYLEFTVETGGIHRLTVSAVTNKDGVDTGSFTPDSYTISFECSAPAEPSPPIEPGDLLASSGSVPGSLISIDPQTGESTLHHPLGKRGPVTEIEFHNDMLYGATKPTNEFNGNIIQIDLLTGEETQVGLDLNAEVTALEFVGDTLYGALRSSAYPDAQLVIINIDDNTADFLQVKGSTGLISVDGLTYDSASGVMYAIGLPSASLASVLVKIDLASFDLPSAPIIQEIGPVGSGQVSALEFGPGGLLFGAAAGFLVTINPDSGAIIAEVSIQPPGGAVTSTLATDLSNFGGLAYVPGDEDQTYVQTLCSSTLANSSPFSSRLASSKFIRSKLRSRVRQPAQPAIRLFMFQGTQAELLTIKLTLEEAEPAVESVDKLTADVDSKKKAFLGLRHTSWWVDFRKMAKGPFPLEIAAELPKDGWYRLVVIQPFRQRYRTNYCLTVESQDPNSVALETLDVAQLRDLWSLKTTQASEEAASVEPQTVSDSDSSKITTSASIGATSVDSTGTTAVEPAEDGTEVSDDDGRTAEVDDDSDTAAGSGVNTEDSVEPDDGPADDDGRTEEVDDDSDAAEGKTVNTEE
jgi:hypothetical protein